MGVVAVGTSILSGVLGMAGGMLLLSALLLHLDPAIAIPVHGIVQFTSNASRAWFLREHIEKKYIIPFALPLLPAGALGVVLLGFLPPAAGKMLIGAFVLAFTWRAAQKRETGNPPEHPARLLAIAGAVVGFFSTLIGATGPLIAPFIMALELAPAATVGTMAACQVFQHASKVAVFGFAGFDFRDQVAPALALSMCAILGSAVGTRWVDRLDRDLFRRVVKIVLTLLALQLLVSGAWALGHASR
ncbi:MAG TPA: sulfite exporter TauE/SafE family protein [Polyangiaceae bacterium]|nr:sulfite exporter TauE/SafE family protein [Polyangiaceae bacterium]